MKPWNIHPGLTVERLQTVGNVIRSARHSAVTSYEPEKGDDPWSLGCVAYARTRSAISKATEKYEWLKVVEAGLHFVFSVGGVPLRFYHGDSESPPDRSLRRNFPEIKAQQLALEFIKVPLTSGIFRIAVETDERGEATSLTLVLVDAVGEPQDSWPIPATAEILPLYEPKPSVDVGPPTVRVRRDDAASEE